MKDILMVALFKNIRFYILCFSFLLSLLIYFRTTATTGDASLVTGRLVQYYALIAASYLYITLLIGPAVYALKFLPFKGLIFKARRACGISTFYFGILHAYLAFFKLLGGFGGLGFLEEKYLTAITLSASALFIFTLMAATSFDFMVRKLTFARWKFLHRFIYLASFFILIHAFLIGSHFSDLSAVIPQVFLGAISVLLLLEANRFDAFLQRKFVNLPRLRISLAATIVFLIFAIFYTR